MIAWLPVVLSVTLTMTGPSAAAPSPSVAASVPAAVRYDAMLQDPLRRVRTTDRIVQQLLGEGLLRSVTFSDLVAAINATDVIVYIQRVGKLPATIAGQLMIVPVPNGQRYLRIQIADHLSPTETIALIGHELRHALEVAAAPDVHDQQGLADLYRRIGEPGGTVHSYDTSAARNTGRRILTELVG